MKTIKIMVTTIITILLMCSIVYAGVDAIRHPSEATNPVIKTETIGYMGILPTDEAVGVYDGYNVIEYEGHNYKIWMEEPDYDK